MFRARAGNTAPTVAPGPARVTMGALIVRDIVTGVEFNIGTGFTAADRREWWEWFVAQTERTPKPVVKYKSFPIGTKDKPRHPVYLGLRPAGA